MSSEAETANDAPCRLSPGIAFADGRYTIASLVRRGTLGEVYRATEASSGAPVGVYLFDQATAADSQRCKRLRDQLAAVASVQHKNVAQTGEVAADGELLYAIVEYVDGNPLSALLARKRAAGEVFSPKGAYNVVAHLCNALDHMHPSAVHALLHPGNILVSRSGRVKIAELGLAGASPLDRGPAAPYAAPELRAGSAPAVAADIYSVGAILYELLTGVTPSPGAKPPSQVTRGLPAAVDAVVARCVAPQPAQRFSSAREVKKALQAAIAAPPARGVGLPAPRATPRRPSLAHQIAHGPGPAAAPADGLSDTTERWLISKDKLDFGPFTLAQVIQQIETNEILPGHTIVDTESGIRTAVEDHDLLHDVVDKAKQRRDDQRRAQAEVHHVRQEKRRGTTLYLVIALGVVLLGVGAYAIVGAMRAAKDDGNQGSVAALEEGELVAKISFVSRDERRRRARRHRRRSAAKAPGGTTAPVRDEYDGPLDLGDVSEGDDASERLDDSQINDVVSRYGSKLGRCLSKTGSRHANIKFVIRGSGKVSFVKVNGSTSSPLARCLDRVMKSMTFPSFHGARTRAEFDIGF